MGEPSDAAGSRLSGRDCAGLLLAGVLRPPAARRGGAGDGKAGREQSAAEAPVRRLSGGPPRAAHARFTGGRHVVRGGAARPTPNSPELISRTFLMEVSVGHFDRAARSGRKRAQARFDRCRGRARAAGRSGQGRRQGRRAQARRGAARDGVHRFVGPLARAWTRMAVGDLAGADDGAAGARQIQRLRAARNIPARAALRFRRQARHGRGNFKKRRSRRAGSSIGG